MDPSINQLAVWTLLCKWHYISRI